MGDKIEQSELVGMFGAEIPMVAVKLLFPEKSEPLTPAELRQVLSAIAAIPPAPDAVEALVKAAGQARLALAGMVSTQSAINMLDNALGDPALAAIRGGAK